MSARRVCKRIDGRRRRTQRALMILLAAALGALAVVTACSRDNVHRMLVFLYDGVPPLGGELTAPEVDAPGTRVAGDAGSPTPRRVAKKVYLHPAFRDNRCGECHVANGGRLLKTAREGLCRSCHPDKPPKKKFTHGPVAVERCMACHVYHKSVHEKILKTDAQSLCFECHEKSTLSTDEHHATIEEERCIDCHDPHGGDKRFFLLPKAEAESDSAP